MAAKKIKLVLVSLMLIIFLMSTSFAAVKTFRVQETDLVKITPDAIDPDNDKVIYYYSTPLDENGEWQTEHDDEGEYLINLTASDGIDQSIKQIKIIVDNRNQAPLILEDKVVTKETQLLDLKGIISDPDDDALEYIFTEPFDNNGQWQTDYDDAGTFVTTIIVSDAEFEVKKRVEVIVQNTNHPPMITAMFTEGTIYNIEEDEKLRFFVEISDNDGDELSYTWTLADQIISEQEEGEYYFDYESAGEYELSLIVDDGTNQAEQEWKIKVEDVNRKPRFKLLPITVNEGEKVYLDLPDLDEDGDVLTYFFEEPLDSNGEWQTDYDDADEYEIKVVASDGELTYREDLEIEVIDVDQAPVLNLPPKIEISEGKELLWYLDTYDLDDEPVTVSFTNFPDNAVYDQREKTFTWTPAYSTLKRDGGLISNILNMLRIEHFFISKKSIPLEVRSCGKDKCSTGLVDLTVYNVNRAPILEKINYFNVEETNLLELNARAYDPDGDIIRYSYTKPLGKRSGQWQTDYDDEGSYTTYVTATDGNNPTTQAVNFDIVKNNRQPTLNVKDDEITVNEGEQVIIDLTAEDPDEDELQLKISNLPPGASLSNAQFVWTPSYDTVLNRSDGNNFVGKFAYLNRKFNSEQEVIWLDFSVTDGDFEVKHPVKVIVKNFNQKPEIIDYLPQEEINAMVGDEIAFQVLAQDADNDKLGYTWNFGLRQTKVKGTNIITRLFTIPGQKVVKVKVDDGRGKVEKKWIINVNAEEVVAVEEVIEEVPLTVDYYVIEVPERIYTNS